MQLSCTSQNNRIKMMDVLFFFWLLCRHDIINHGGTHKCHFHQCAQPSGQGAPPDRKQQCGHEFMTCAGCTWMCWNHMNCRPPFWRLLPSLTSVREKLKRKTFNSHGQMWGNKIFCEVSLERILGFQHKWVQKTISTNLNQSQPPNRQAFWSESASFTFSIFCVMPSITAAWRRQGRKSCEFTWIDVISCGLVLFWLFDAFV